MYGVSSPQTPRSLGLRIEESSNPGVLKNPCVSGFRMLEILENLEIYGISGCSDPSLGSGDLGMPEPCDSSINGSSVRGH